MANGIKKWALTTSWKALHQGNVFLLFSEKHSFSRQMNDGGAAERQWIAGIHDGCD